MPQWSKNRAITAELPSLAKISLARLGNPELRDDCGITGQNISNQFASIAAEFSWYSIVIVGPFGIIALGILRSSQQKPMIGYFTAILDLGRIFSTPWYTERVRVYGMRKLGKGF
jgi:hypothetical protein